MKHMDFKHLSGAEESYLGCYEGEDESEAPVLPFTILIYGGGGDLSRKKLLPNLYTLFAGGFLPESFSIVCAGSPQDADTESFRDLVRASLRSAEKNISAETMEGFVSRVHFKALRFHDDKAFGELKTLVESVGPRSADGRLRVLYFLAVPPAAFDTVISQTGRFGMNSGDWDARLIIEKPFGTDLASARDLNRSLRSVFEEDRIFRIDHYLGKETVQNILFFRFSNSMFEPLWNNKYIDNVQITVAEDIGIESRGKFYDPSGVIRDIVQNHALQLLALVAMEPPAAFDADSIRDEKAKVQKSMVPLGGDDIFRSTVAGQYAAGTMKNASGQDMVAKAYREEDFVAPDSVTPTYFAGRFHINNWRWAGVPFYVRAGKRLGARKTDIVIQFRKTPHLLFGQCQNHEPGTLTLSIQPREAITLRYEVKYPNTVRRVWPVTMTFDYQDAFQVQSLPAYARLILDALKDDLSLFVRQDCIDLAWQLADPLIEAWQKKPGGPEPYAPGSPGPSGADALLAADGRRWLSDLSPGS